MCFRPNCLASTDQAPGPIMAKAAAKIARAREIHGSPECEENREIAIQTLVMAASAPATGVRNPTKRTIPHATPTICKTMISVGVPPSTLRIPKLINVAPISKRRSRRPTPGQPSANVENSRCKTCPSKRVEHSRLNPQAGNWDGAMPLSGH